MVATFGTAPRFSANPRCMSKKHVYRLSDFARSCQLIEEARFTVKDAKCHGWVFGSWTIELSQDGHVPHLIVWDGRDRCMILQSHGPGEEWVDEWVIREPQHDAVQQIIARLKN